MLSLESQARLSKFAFAPQVYQGVGQLLFSVKLPGVVYLGNHVYKRRLT